MLILLIGMVSYGRELIPQQNAKGKWGYVDADGNKVIDYRYNEAGMFVEGLAKVKKGKLYGMIDETGREIIPIKYNIIERYNDKAFMVAKGGKEKDGLLENEKYGFLDRQGKPIIKPEYNQIGNFNDGVALVVKGTKKPLYGYINENLDFIVYPMYKYIGSFNKNGYVWHAENGSTNQNGRILMKNVVIRDKNGKIVDVGTYLAPITVNKLWGTHLPSQDYELTYVDLRIAMEAGPYYALNSYDFAYEPFSKIPEDAVGYIFMDKLNGKGFTMMSPIEGAFSGNDAEPPKFMHPLSSLSQPHFPTDSIIIGRAKGGGYNMHKVGGYREILKEPVEFLAGFENGVAITQIKKGEMRLINTKGEFISKPYQLIFPQSNGIYIVRKTFPINDKLAYYRYGAIDSTGKEIVGVTHRYLFPVKEGLMAGTDYYNQAGFRKTDGSWMRDPIYKATRPFDKGLAFVKSESGWGLVDKELNEVVKPLWPSCIELVDDGVMWVSTDTVAPIKYSPLEVKTGKLLTNQTFTSVFPFGEKFEGMAVVGTKDKDGMEMFGLMSRDGSMLVPNVLFKFELDRAYSLLNSTPNHIWDDFDTYRIGVLRRTNGNEIKVTDTLDANYWDY